LSGRTNQHYNKNNKILNMKTFDQDKNQNNYIRINNIRITYIDGGKRKNAKNWKGKDTIKIQAYKNDYNETLFQGAEVPINTSKTLIKIIAALCKLHEKKH